MALQRQRLQALLCCNQHLISNSIGVPDGRCFASLLGLSSATQQHAPFTSSSTSQQQQQQQQQQREASFASHDTYVCSVQTNAAQQPCYVAATGARAVVQQDQQLHCAHSAHSWHGPWNPRQQLHGESLWAIRPDTGSPTSNCLHTVHSYSLTAGRASYSTTTSSSSSQLGGPPNSSDDRSSSSSKSSSGGSSSVPPSSWLLQHLPAAAVPYAQLMRLDKPIGSWLLAWPGLWSIGLVAAPGHLPDLWLTALFGTGAVLMRGAGCTINDLWDRDIDKQVERTRSRPLAAGTITPLAALVFLGAQLSASLAILLQLNTYTQVLGVASLGLVATYPLMKRITWWPQAFLGLAMNYGALMGYSAAAGACDWAVVAPLYAAGVSWTLIYDTIYAHQDKRDDALVGVKSTALLFGDKTNAWASGFAVTNAAGMLLAGASAGCGLPYFAGVAAGSAHITWQIRSVDLHDGPDCMAKFVSNQWYGALIYAGVVLDHLMAVAL